MIWRICWTGIILLAGGLSAAPQQERGRDLNQDLIDALQKGDFEKTKALIRKGADVNRPDREGNTPLGYLILHRNTGLIEGMKLLIDAGANVNTPNQSKRTPLMLAAADLKREAIELLLQKGARPNEVNADGDTALMLAVRRALHLPADMSDRGVEGVHKELDAIAILMLDAGADPRLHNKKGETALSLAEQDRYSSPLVEHLKAPKPSGR
jgi:ankyrin repeat protein